MSSMPQIRLRTLLKEDEVFKAWFMKPPEIKVFHTTPPWRIFVQMEQDGRWRRGDFPSYAKAFGGVKLRLSEAWDMTIHCRPQGFRPPVLKYQGKKVYAPLPEGHEWCDHCRRPVVFGNFSKHHNISRYYCDYNEPRCSICGARKISLPRRPMSPLSWPARLASK